MDGQMQIAGGKAMTDLLTESEAARFLRKDEETLRNLRRRHKIGYVRGRPATYTMTHLLDYIKQNEVKPCVVSQHSSNSVIKVETSNPLIGTSSITSEDAVAVALRAVKSARKTMRHSSSSIHGFSKERN